MKTCKFKLKSGPNKGNKCEVKCTKQKWKIMHANGDGYKEVEVDADYCKRHFEIVNKGLLDQGQDF
jgi:hypothetical protein